MASLRLPRPSIQGRAVLSRSRTSASADARADEAAATRAAGRERELRAQRDRLVERFTVMQSDLGGAFYEMAIRDHVRMDVLTRKAAMLQRVDEELQQVERAIALQRTGVAGQCPACAAPFAPGAGFCSQCGSSLTASVEAH
jgi:hypothetical protein